MNKEKLESILIRIENHLDSLVRLNLSLVLSNCSFDDIELKVFEMTGQKKRNEICKELKISPNRLADIWNNLLLKGLLTKDGKQYKKIA